MIELYPIINEAIEKASNALEACEEDIKDSYLQELLKTLRKVRRIIVNKCETPKKEGVK